MNAPPLDVLHAIDRLSANGDFNKVIAWLEKERVQAVDDLLEQVQENRVLQEQGYTRCLQDLMRTFLSAKLALERHSNRETMNT